MNDHKIYTAIGLMSGTSMDGIDVALVKTDGYDAVECGPSLTLPFEAGFVGKLRQCLGPTQHLAPGVCDIERELTRMHGVAVMALMEKASLNASDIDVIGFHGHTVHHDPAQGVTVQLGNGRLLADMLGISVVCDFRTNDVKHGGQGAPLVPVFHRALAQGLSDILAPFCILNIGGVANVTWVKGAAQDVADDLGAVDLLAFDTGPGNAPLNDWVHRHTGDLMDQNGHLASQGKVDDERILTWVNHDYFKRKPPKSLDRQDFADLSCAGLNLHDGAATLTAFVAHAAQASQRFFPKPAGTWIVSGGGRLNPVMMEYLKTVLDGDILVAEDVGWQGDALEAQAFGYLAVRSICDLPLTFPTTTGVTLPLCGGTLNQKLNETQDV